MSEQRHIQEGAKEIARLLDDKQNDTVENRLLSDMLNMKPREFKQLVEKVNQLDDKKTGANLDLTFDGKQMKVAIADPRSGKAESLADGFNGGEGRWRFNKSQVYDRVFGNESGDQYSSAIEQNPQNLQQYYVRQSVREASSRMTAAQIATPEGKANLQRALQEGLNKGYGAGVMIQSIEIQKK